MNAKILVISNEAFSDSGSNSRTMKNFLQDIPRENIAQFYLHGIPDTDFCTHYFRVSDQDALRAFLGKGKKERENKDENSSGDATDIKKPPKSYRNLLIRNIVWQTKRWWNRDFDEFLTAFAPNIVLLQAGDAPFLYAVARLVAKQCGARLVMFNSESYVLKKRIYSSKKGAFFWHFWLKASLRKQYRKFMKKVDYCIYSLNALEDACQKKYPHPGKSCTLYTVSELSPLPDCSQTPFTVLYCGNLGVGRDEPLAEFAQVLREVDDSAELHIYGKFRDAESEARVCNHPNVYFHGFVDYAQVPQLMSRVSLLIHCEHPARLENLRYAFSTKIADSLACGRPFLVYAAKEYPFVHYLQTKQCAHIASDQDELKCVLEKCISDRTYLYQYTENGLRVAKENHNQQENCRKIHTILEQLSTQPEAMQ